MLTSVDSTFVLFGVLSTEVNTFKRRINEAIQIKLTKPALNRDNGYELAAVYDTILTPKRR